MLFRSASETPKTIRKQLKNRFSELLAASRSFWNRLGASGIDLGCQGMGFQLSPASMTPSLASRTPNPASKTHSPVPRRLVWTPRRLVWRPTRLVRPPKSSNIIEKSIFRASGSFQELLESSGSLWNQFGLSRNGLCSFVQLRRRQVWPPRRLVQPPRRIV